MNEMLDPAAVKAAAAAMAMLIPHLTGADTPPPITGAGQQVALALVEDQMRWTEGAAAAVHTLHPGPDARAVDQTLFDAGESALAWFAQARPGMISMLQLAASVRADRQLWRTAYAIEALASHTGDLNLWGQASLAGLRAAERLGDPKARTFMHLMRGGWYKMTNPAAALPDYTEALKGFRTLRDEHMEVLTLIRLGAVHLVMRRLPEAEGCFEQVVARAADDVAVGLGVLNQATTRLHSGDYAAAVDLGYRALELLADAEPHYAVQVYIDLVRCHALTGDFEAGEEALRSGVAQASIGPSHAGRRLGLLAAEAELRLAQGRHRQVIDLANRWLSGHGELGTDTGHADVLDLLARAVLAEGDPARAVDVHRSALGRRRRAQVPFGTAETLVHLAEACEAAGQLAEAENRRAEAVKLLAGCVDPAADDLRRKLGGQP